MPARFVREMLCLRRSRGRLRAHRELPVAGALRRPRPPPLLRRRPDAASALNADDVSIPDIGKLTTLLRAAERTGGALPRKRHRMWVTEVSYDSSPPDPQGVPAAQHARFLEQAFYLLWKQGVDTITWFQIRDQLPQPSYAASSQSGIYFADGRAKPAQRAFRFPLVAERAGRASLRVWGRAPVAGIGAHRAPRAARLAARPDRARDAPRHVPRCGSRRAAARALRARVGGETSLAWPAT